MFPLLSDLVEILSKNFGNGRCRNCSAPRVICVGGRVPQLQPLELERRDLGKRGTRNERLPGGPLWAPRTRLGQDWPGERFGRSSGPRFWAAARRVIGADLDGS